MNTKIDKLKLALAEAKETIKTLKSEFRALKVDHKEALKAVKVGIIAKATQSKTTKTPIKKSPITKKAVKAKPVAKKAVKKAAQKKVKITSAA